MNNIQNIEGVKANAQLVKEALKRCVENFGIRNEVIISHPPIDGVSSKVSNSCCSMLPTEIVIKKKGF